MSNLSLRDATEADIERIVEVQFSAFEGDPYQEALFPGEYYSAALRKEAYDRTLRYFRSDPTAQWKVCVDQVTNTIYGFALWNVYDNPRPESEWRKAPEVDWCIGRQKEIAFNFLSLNQGLRERIWGGRPYVLLNLLCIHQDLQRQGAGTMLVQQGLALAESLGLPAYLEASTVGYHLYSKLGFEQFGTATIKAEDWDGDHDRTLVAMVRPTLAK